MYDQFIGHFLIPLDPWNTKSLIVDENVFFYSEVGLFKLPITLSILRILWDKIKENKLINIPHENKHNCRLSYCLKSLDTPSINQPIRI